MYKTRTQILCLQLVALVSNADSMQQIKHGSGLTGGCVQVQVDKYVPRANECDFPL